MRQRAPVVPTTPSFFSPRNTTKTSAEIVFEDETNGTIFTSAKESKNTLELYFPYFENRDVESLVVIWLAVLIMILFLACLFLALIRLHYRRITQREIQKIHEEFREARAQYPEGPEGERVFYPPPLSPPGTDPMIDEKWFKKHRF